MTCPISMPFAINWIELNLKMCEIQIILSVRVILSALVQSLDDTHLAVWDGWNHPLIIPLFPLISELKRDRRRRRDLTSRQSSRCENYSYSFRLAWSNEDDGENHVIECPSLDLSIDLKNLIIDSFYWRLFCKNVKSTIYDVHYL